MNREVATTKKRSFDSIHDRSHKSTSSIFTEFEDVDHTVMLEQESIFKEARMSYYQWARWLSNSVNSLGGWKEVENSKLRQGSNEISKTTSNTTQFRAQYGRANPTLIQTVICAARITDTDSFLDIGSGIGQVCLQVAATVGCPAVGVELLEIRHRMGLVLQKTHEDHNHLLLCGPVKLIHGDFTDPKFKNIVVAATVLFINNACGTFAERCVDAGKTTLNSHVALLVRQVEKKTRIICFEKITELETDELGQVFEKKEIVTLPEPACWSSKPLKLTMYTKLGNTWKCQRCTYQNKLIDEYCCPIRTCQGCSEDPEGMQRSNYELRRKN